MPRSPWLASAGWTNSAGVPVEASVAAILRADEAALAHAGDDHAALDRGKQVQRPAETGVQAGGQRIQPLGRQTEDTLGDSRSVGGAVERSEAQSVTSPLAGLIAQF